MPKAPATSRRDLAFASLDDLSAELDRIEVAHNAGTLGTTGGWTPAENLDHTSRVMTFPMDGFPPGRPPLPVRVVATLMFKKSTIRDARASRAMAAGIKLPKGVESWLPEAGATVETGIARHRDVARRLAAGERYTLPSPLFGPIEHDDWVAIQCSHCALHWGYLTLG